MGHKFEIFSAGCELCKRAIETVRDIACENCEIVEYDLQNPIKGELKEKLEKYNVLVVPKKAVKKINGKTIVKVFKDEQVEEREIQIGLKGEDFYEIHWRQICQKWPGVCLPAHGLQLHRDADADGQGAAGELRRQRAGQVISH